MQGLGLGLRSKYGVGSGIVFGAPGDVYGLEK